MSFPSDVWDNDPTLPAHLRPLFVIRRYRHERGQRICTTKVSIF